MKREAKLPLLLLLTFMSTIITLFVVNTALGVFFLSVKVLRLIPPTLTECLFMSLVLLPLSEARLRFLVFDRNEMSHHIGRKNNVGTVGKPKEHEYTIFLE